MVIINFILFRPRTASMFNPLKDVGAPNVTKPAKAQAFYAIVLHNFEAERADELDAKQGDAVTVVAQSNREWFVAKPIGKLGRPGLIPVSFVEIRDPATNVPVADVNALIDQGLLPRVEDWKQAMMSYKANSISLGVLDDPPSQKTAPTAYKTPPAKLEPAVSVQGPSPVPYQQQQQIRASQSRPLTPCLPDGILLSAEVKSFHYEMDEYWFRVHAVFQPYDRSSYNLPNAKQLILFRSYNDFYDFQVSLLNTFPEEGGRNDSSTRILPFMPGPAEHVDNEITISRRVELDEYMHKLCDLQHQAKYIVEHKLIREFLALKPGDADLDIEPRTKEIEALQRASYAELSAAEQRSYDVDPPATQMSRLQISDRAEGRWSDGSYYAQSDGGRQQDGETYDHSGEQDLRSVQPLRPRARTPSNATHHRAESSASLYRSANGNQSRTNSPLPSRAVSSLQEEQYLENTQSRSSIASSHDPSPVSMRSSQTNSVATSNTSLSGRSRSQSNAAYKPPISATNPQTAFIKIKIFDRTTDDLVAIRVHPRVTHAQLMDKVQARLGDNVSNLRYRDSLSNDFVELATDEELSDWLDSTDRHVLYAD